jgi:hypothetical protein
MLLSYSTFMWDGQILSDKNSRRSWTWIPQISRRPTRGAQTRLRMYQKAATTGCPFHFVKHAQLFLACSMSWAARFALSFPRVKHTRFLACPRLFSSPGFLLVIYTTFTCLFFHKDTVALESNKLMLLRIINTSHFEKDIEASKLSLVFY